MPFIKRTPGHHDLHIIPPKTEPVKSQPLVEKEAICQKILEAVQKNLTPSSKQWVKDTQDRRFIDFEKRIEQICHKELDQLGLNSTNKFSFVKDIIIIAVNVLDISNASIKSDKVKNDIHNLCVEKFQSTPPTKEKSSPLKRQVSRTDLTASATSSRVSSIVSSRISSSSLTPQLARADSAPPEDFPASQPPGAPDSPSSAPVAGSPKSHPRLTHAQSSYADHVHIDYETLDAQELQRLAKDVHQQIASDKGKLVNLTKRKKVIQNKLNDIKKKHVQTLTFRFPSKWREFDTERLEKSDLTEIEKLNREIMYHESRIASLPKEGVYDFGQRKSAIHEHANRIAELEQRKLQIKNKTDQHNDPMEDQILELTEQLVDLQNEMQELDLNIQTGIQKFVAIYSLFATRKFGIGKLYATDTNFNLRSQDQVEQLFKNQKFKHNFPKPNFVDNHQKNIDKLYENRKELMNKIGELNTALQTTTHSRRKQDIRREIALKEKAVNALNEKIEILQSKLLVLEKEYFREQLQKEVQKIVNHCYLQGIKDKEINVFFKRRFEGYGDKFIQNLSAVVKNEMEVVESHYKSMALLNIEYDLNVPGLTEDSSAQFNFSKWKSMTGNLRKRMENGYLKSNLLQKVPSDQQITDFCSFIDKSDHGRNLISERDKLLVKIKTNQKKFELAKTKLKEFLVHYRGTEAEFEELSKLKEEFKFLRDSIIKAENQLIDLVSRTLEYHLMRVVSSIVGKGLDDAEIRKVIETNFPEITGDALLDVIHFVKQEVNNIEERHREIDDHMSLYLPADTFLRPGFSDSPTAFRIVVKDLEECLDFNNLAKSKTSEEVSQEGAHVDRMFYNPDHLKELQEFVKEEMEELEEGADRLLFGQELLALNFDLQHLREEAHASLHAKEGHAAPSIKEHTSSRVTSHAKVEEEAFSPKSDLPIGAGLTAQTMRGLFAVWELHSSNADRSKLKKELKQSKAEKSRLEAILKHRVEGLKELTRKEGSDRLSETFLHFINSFNLDEIRDKGLSAKDIKTIVEFYEKYELHGNTLFHSHPDANPEIVSRGKEILESLIRSASLSKNLYMLDCNIRMKQAVVDKNKKEFIHQCLVNGPIALGSFFQTGASSATLAAAHQVAGFDPVGASKQALKMGLPLAGMVVGFATMLAGGKAAYSGVEKYQSAKKEIEAVSKEIRDLEKQAALADSDSEKVNLELMIFIKKSQKARIALNDSVLAELRAARGAFDVATGAANITSGAVTVAGAAAVAGVSATGIGLAVVAGLGVLAGATMSINEYLKQKKFQPVLKQLEKVHEAQKKYQASLQDKTLEQGLDKMHAELHTHLTDELQELEHEIDVLREMYQEYLDKEIQTRMSTFWWIKDDQGESLRTVLQYIDHLHNEKPDEKAVLMKLIQSLEKDLGQISTFKPGENLKARAKKLVETTVLGNVKQGLMGSVGVFKSHALTPPTPE